MPNTGNVFPATAENVTRTGSPTPTVWSTPADAISDNGLDATCNSSTSSGSQYLVARNFGLALPAATIGGITVRIEVSETGSGTETVNVQLQNDTGALFGTAKTFVASGTGKVVYTLGSTSDLWGATLTQAIVNSASFGVRMWFTTTHSVQVDYFTLAVEYVGANVTVALTGVAGTGTASNAVVFDSGAPPEGGSVFPGPIFPEEIFPGPIFPGTAPTTDVTVSATSVAANVDAGTVVGSVGFPATAALTGVNTFTGSGFSGAGAGGGVFPGEIFPDEIFPGEVFPGGGGSGAVPIGGVGIVIPSTRTVHPAVVVNSNVGFVVGLGDQLQSLIGVVVQARAGTVVAVPDRTTALTGVAVNARAGTATQVHPITLTGVEAITGTLGLGGGNDAWGTSWGTSWGTAWTLVGQAAAWGEAWGDSWGESWGRVGSLPIEGVGIVLPRTTVAGTGARANAANGLPTIIGVQNRKTPTGVVVNANAGFATGGTDKVASLTGVAVNARAGSVLSPIAGNRVNAAAGTVVLGTSVVSLTGVAVNAVAQALASVKSKDPAAVLVNVAAGILRTVQALTGVTAKAEAGVPGSARDRLIPQIPTERAEAGTVTTSRTVALVGVQVNAAAGTASVTDIGLTGVVINALAGSVAAGADKVRPLIGVAVNAAAGIVSLAARSLALNGTTANAAAGTVAVLDRSFALTGVAVNAAAGTATPIADRTAALTGVRVNGLAYFVTTGNDIVTPLYLPNISAVVGAFFDPDTIVHLNTHQVESTATAGAVFAGADRNTGLTGVAVNAEASFVPQVPITLIGVNANASAGSTAQTENRRICPSVVTTVSVGFITKQNDSIVQLVGVDVVAGDVVTGAGIITVGPPVTFGTDRHTGVRPARKTKADLEALDRELALMED